MVSTLRANTTESYDVIVVGAGHAGIEAALAAARVGARVLVLTTNLDRVGYMPCNPSIGGPAKAHIVAEIDALGGEMARAIDRTAIQIRMLNASKGPAVQALRAQADKNLYSMAMKEALELQPGVTLRQESVSSINLARYGTAMQVADIETSLGSRYRCGAAVITAGTFLRGSLISGEWKSAGGRTGDSADQQLAATLADAGIRTHRLKTGTPPRVDARTIDFSLTEVQHGSDEPLWFSRAGTTGEMQRLTLPALSIYPDQRDDWRPQLPCYHVETNLAGHELIAANVDRSPMYNGAITGTGTRYCPSIEDKVMRFPDKERHGFFLEPEGWRTTEVYIQGCNTSLPNDVQLAFLRTIPALANASITRYGYAVEYDAIEPTELLPSFASKRVNGLYLAGQVNGTSGYEEAAGQGLMAGLNAARWVANQTPVVLARDEAYIGVMADDLTTQEFHEPYRMLTSRAEHRLRLRADNAEFRLVDVAADAGLISASRADEVRAERDAVRQTSSMLQSIHLSPNATTNEALVSRGLPDLRRSMTAADYVRRPDASLDLLLPYLHEVGAVREPLAPALVRQIEIETTYSAYAEKQQLQIDRARRMEHLSIPAAFEYAAIAGMRNEAREKLERIRPATIGQAGRIAGVTPSDLAVLLVHVRRATESAAASTS